MPFNLRRITRVAREAIENDCGTFAAALYYRNHYAPRMVVNSRRFQQLEQAMVKVFLRERKP